MRALYGANSGDQAITKSLEGGGDSHSLPLTASWRGKSLGSLQTDFVAHVGFPLLWGGVAGRALALLTNARISRKSQNSTKGSNNSRDFRLSFAPMYTKV